jgi:ribose 5-phosphate isomerase A
MPDQHALKQAAARYAARYVSDGMLVGLGSGTTAELVVREIGERVRRGLQVRGIPTSNRTARLAEELNIPLITLEDCDKLDITIDGADEVVPGSLSVIKGLGGALLREKIVALASDLHVLVVDGSKVVGKLGERTPVPVEVVQFGWTLARDALAKLGCEPVRRSTPDHKPYITDGGNYLLDCRFPPIDDPASLAQRIKAVTGVVEHGLFIGIAHRVVVARESGIEVLERDG